MKIKTHSKLAFIVILSVLTFVSCKDTNSITDFKYADKPEVINCEGTNSKLYNEALYAFENDILNYYKKSNSNTTVIRAYSQFIRTSVYQQPKLNEMVSKHTYEVFEALKNENNLWDANNKKSHLNYQGKTLQCIADNIKDPALKTTFNALVSTNTMSPKLFGTPLTSKYSLVMNDRYLALYAALDLFYAKMFDFDFSNENFAKPIEEKVDFNQKPQPVPGDPHAGHNHD